VSEASEIEGGAQPRQSKGKGKRKSRKKRDGWIWLEGYTGHGDENNEKLVEYRKESESRRECF
jgi:hypothetical protein